MHLTSLVSLRFLKFLLSGGFGATCYVIGSSLLTFAGLDAWVASLLMYSCLIPIVYSIQKRFVFRADEIQKNSFLRYMIIQFFGIGLSASLPLILGKLGIDPILSFVCVVVLITFTNYSLQLCWVFKENNSKFRKSNEID